MALSSMNGPHCLYHVVIETRDGSINRWKLVCFRDSERNVRWNALQSKHIECLVLRYAMFSRFFSSAIGCDSNGYRSG